MGQISRGLRCPSPRLKNPTTFFENAVDSLSGWPKTEAMRDEHRKPSSHWDANRCSATRPPLEARARGPPYRTVR